jgi:hypothetical protein
MNAKAPFRISALAVALALGAIPGWAQQQSGVEGATAGLDLISGTTLDTLAFATVTIPATGSVWHCVATCSIEAAHIGGTGTDVDGRLALVRNGVEVAGTDRKFELNDNADVNDPEVIEVSTTGRMLNLFAGNHTIACAAAKVVSTDRNFNVNDSSLSIVCSDFQL